MDRSWTVLESQVDWITATARTGHGGTELLDLGATILTEERSKGNYGRSTTFEGYHGTVSQHCFVGYRLDGACIRLGGSLARDRWGEVAHIATNVSRLDVAVTAVSNPSTDHLAVDYWRGTPRLAVRGGRQLEYTLIQTRGAGDTLYCGRRSSERFGRIYDKHFESKGLYPRGSWRFELEYKGGTAKEVASRLAAATDVPRAILGIVENRYQEWGMITPWDTVTATFSDRAPRTPTDNDSRMKWLTEQVSGTVETLSSSYTGEQLRKALGLQIDTTAQPLLNQNGDLAPEYESRIPHPTIPGCYIVSDG